MLPRTFPAASTSAPPSAASSNAGNLSLPGLLLVQKLMERGEKWQKDVARKLANRGYPLEDVLILAKFLFDDTPAQGFDPSIIARMKEVAELALEIFQQTRPHFESLPADALMSRYPINNELFQMLWKEGYKQAALNFWLETDQPRAPFAFLQFGVSEEVLEEGEELCECNRAEIKAICKVIMDVLKEWTVSNEDGEGTQASVHEAKQDGKQTEVKKRKAPDGGDRKENHYSVDDLKPDPSGFDNPEEGYANDDDEPSCPDSPMKRRRE